MGNVPPRMVELSRLDEHYRTEYDKLQEAEQEKKEAVRERIKEAGPPIFLGLAIGALVWYLLANWH